MNQKFDKYLATAPEIVFEWSDSKTEAKGWVVINSLKNGAAGGGTRMREGLTKDEVLALAKVMEIKFSVSGPAIGGAKSGINFNPADPRKKEVLERWFKAVIPLLKSYYGTGGDLNVDEILEVNPITEDYGLWHPQEGVVNGHFKPNSGDKVRKIGQLRTGCNKIVEDNRFVPGGPRKFAIADMVTGYGVAEAVKAFYDLYHQKSPDKKRAIIQGWGNVASSAAFFLAEMGVKIVGIIDKNAGLISEDGFSRKEIGKFFQNKKGNQLNVKNALSFEETNQKIWDIPADIFIPGAASRIVSRDQVDRMLVNGLEIMSCGANVPFVDDGISFGPTAKYTDSKIALIPDFIANCGMARTFAYLMGDDVELTDEAIFNDISATIFKAIREVQQHNPEPKGISTTALDIALEK
ncbi:MAG: amino acid dehydrogenase [Saprospirales bacterium]|nr:MAG: amino acid dehydrogenase [Saprospirales bacterium]